MASAQGSMISSPIIRVCLRILSVIILLITPLAIKATFQDFLEGRDSDNWPHTKGEVYDHRVYENIRKRNGIEVGRSYTVNVCYRFKVGDREYRGDRFSPASPRIGAETEDEARMIVLQHPLESEVDVSYSPSDPSKSFMQPGLSMLAVWKPLLITLIMPTLAIGLWVATRKAKIAPPRQHKAEEDLEYEQDQ